MSQLTFYKYATWGLLVLNIAIVAFMFLMRPGPRSRPTASSNNFRNEVIRALGLTEDQENTFKQLAAEHSQSLRAISEQQQGLLPPYFKSLSDSSKKIDEEAILRQFEQLERQKIEITHQHLLDVKSRLRGEQLANFDSFMDRFIDKLLLDNGRKPPPPKKRR